MECHREDQRGWRTSPMRSKLGLLSLERESLWEPHNTIPLLKGQLHREMPLFMTEAP